MTLFPTPSARRSAAASIRSVLSCFARPARLLAAAVLATAAAIPASAQSYTWTQRAASRYWTAAASSADGVKLIAATGVSPFGAPGDALLYLSTNSGATWTATHAATVNGGWQAVASSADGQTLIACSSSSGTNGSGPGQIYTSPDGGTTWTLQSTGAANKPPTGSWYAAQISSDGQKMIAALSDGILPVVSSIWVSTNGGTTWSSHLTGTNRYWAAAAVSANGNLFAAGDQGLGIGPFFTSTNGSTWEQTTANQKLWSRLAMSADGSGILGSDFGAGGTGAANALYFSTNSGASFTTVTSAIPGDHTWTAVASDSTGQKFAAADADAALAGLGGKIWTSTNGGTAWTSQSTAGTRNWTALASSSDGSKLIAAVGDGFLYTGVLAAVLPTVTGISPSSGSTAGGTSVTITGTGFTGAPGVTIGGTAATSVMVVSATSITCTTPAGTAGQKSVIVTTPGGSNAANTLFTYVSPPAAPTITSVTGPVPGSYRAGAVLSFTVNFSTAVTVTGTPQLPLTIGSAARTATYGASGSGPTALTFTHTVLTGDNDSDGIASASPLALNGGTINATTGGTAATLTFTPPTTTGVKVDTTVPAAASINRAGSTNPTNATSVTFTVTFSESVTGVDAADFAKTGTANGTISGVTGSGATYTVTVNSVSGNGTLGLDQNASGTAILDAAGNAIAGGFTGQSYTIDTTAPTISISAPSASTATTGPITYTVTYADANFGSSTLTAPNVTLNKTGTADGTVAVTGSGTTRTVTISSITGTGTLGISIAAGTASDTAGNTAPAAGPSALFTVNNTPALPNQPPTFTLPKEQTLWGAGKGYLGDGKKHEEFGRVQITEPLNWESVACGGAHTVGVDASGRLFAWGIFEFLGLGNNSEQHDRSSPAQVGQDSNWESGWESVTCGLTYTMALRNNGELWAWGRNDFGQLGVGSTANVGTPTRVGEVNYISVACAEFRNPADTNTLIPANPPSFAFTYAVRRDGTLWGWGGTKGLTPTQNPTQIGTDIHWISVAATDRHVMLTDYNGRLWALGRNTSGQLGLGNTSHVSVPTQVGFDTDWVQVACGKNHTLALKRPTLNPTSNNRDLWGWGDNQNFQIMEFMNSKSSYLTPFTFKVKEEWAPDTPGFIRSIVCRDNASFAVDSPDGYIWKSGQFGSPSKSNQPRGWKKLVNSGNKWASVAIGANHYMSLKLSNVISWGRNFGPMTVPDFATDINPGGEAGQTVSFTVTTDNPGLFSAGPAITPSNNASPGTLTFTPKAGESGKALVTVTAVDNGGNANGGRDTSAQHTFEIRIIANGVQASTYADNNNPIDLVNKTLINDTGAPATLSGPVTMGGTSGVACLPGQGLTFTGARTFSGSEVTLETDGSVNFAGEALPLSAVTIKFTGTQPDLTLANPGIRLNQDFVIDDTIVDDGNCSTGIFKIPGTGTLEASCLRLEFDPVQSKATWKAKSLKVKPGSSPGTTLMLSGNWGAGAVYECEIRNATGTAGQPDGWDLWDCTGSLTLAPATGKKHGIILKSLTTGNASGPMANFNKNAPYAWKIISATGGITGFSAENFDLDASGIENDFSGGSFGIALQNSNRDLVVTYTPALRTANWTNDATSGIGTGTLWARRFGSTTAATINGVSIPGINTTTVSSAEFDLTGTSLNYLPVDANTLTGLSGQGSAEMAKYFVYNGNPASLTLKQLTPGYRYTVSLFSAGWDTTPGIRVQTFASGTDTRALDQNAYGDNAGNRLDYTFTADAATRTLTITPPSAGFSFHLYGLALRLETLLPPVVSAQAATGITATGATLNGTVVSSDARSPFVARGFVIAATATNSAPELFGFGVTDVPVAGTTGAFSQAISDLVPGTPYSVAAYAENDEGISYSSVVTFTTPGSAVTPVAPADFKVTRNGANYGFSFTSVSGLSYTLWQSDNLALGSWTNTGLPAIPGDGTGKSFTLPVPSSTVPKRFYRVQAQ